MAPADIRWMRRALTLARRGAGITWPNPPVGAVLVRDGRKLGEGWHRGAGLPHAEVEAVRSCRTLPQGATLYVTLEPCSTQGRTPPCTDLIVRSGIARVVVGCRDPNPQHAGRGFELLRRAGVTVIEECLPAECTDLIAPFAKRIGQGLPYVTLKLGLTLDGRIADRRGVSQWITGPAARAAVQELRRRCDGILVGAGTVLADDPSLTCRLPGAGPRWRIVIDGAGRVPATARILNDTAGGTTILCTGRAAAQTKRVLDDGDAVRVWRFNTRAGRLSLRMVLRRLASSGLNHLLCEGGGDLAGGLLCAGLVDECVFFVAPAILGDERARSGVRGADFLLSTMPRFELVETRVCGDDVMIRVKRRV